MTTSNIARVELGHVFPARYESTCKSCGALIVKGTDARRVILHPADGSKGKGKTYHATPCAVTRYEDAMQMYGGAAPDPAPVPPAPVAPAPVAPAPVAPAPVAPAPVAPAPVAPAPGSIDAMIDARILEHLGDFDPKTAHGASVTIQAGDLPPITVGTHHPVMLSVLQAFEIEEPVMLVGPAGTGKTTMAEQVAEVRGTQCYVIEGNEDLTTADIWGRDVLKSDGSSEKVPGPAWRAARDGGVLLVDESDAILGSVLISLNRLAANRKYTCPDTGIDCSAHDDFRIMMACNTFGNGATAEYAGRQVLDGATLDRFALGTFTMDYDRDLETALCPDQELRERLWKLRAATRAHGVRKIVGTRALVKGYKWRQAFGLSIEDIVNRITVSWTEDEKSHAGV